MSHTTAVILGGFAVAGIPALICWVLVPRLVTKTLITMLTVHDHEEPPVTEHQRKRVVDARTIIIIALSAVLVVAAIMIRLSNVAEDRANADRDRVVSCLQDATEQIELWANGSDDGKVDGVVDVLQASRDATAILRDATAEFNRSVDSLFQLLFRFYAGQSIDDATVQRVITKYQNDKAALFKATADAQQVTRENPYPRLELVCKEN